MLKAIRNATGIWVGFSYLLVCYKYFLYFKRLSFRMRNF